jgi:hypothetical protein
MIIPGNTKAPNLKTQEPNKKSQSIISSSNPSLLDLRFEFWILFGSCNLIFVILKQTYDYTDN